MQQSTARFGRDVVGSHDVVVRCEVIDPVGAQVSAMLNVTGGSISVDSGRKTRRQCTMTFEDPEGDLVPDVANAILQPYSGYMLRIYRGIRWQYDGSEELKPLGTYAPYNPDVSDTGDSLEIKVTGYDRSKIISRLRWTEPYYIASGTNTATAIKNILDNRMPGLKYNFAPTQATVPAMILGVSADQADPWDDATKIASADGMELFFDENDVVVLRRIPDPDKDPIVRTFQEGPDCTVTSFARTNDGEQMYTGVVVYTEGSEVVQPLRVAVWRDDTPLRIPYFFQTSLITTEAQAIATAQTLLRRVGRAEFSATIDIIPDPRQQVGDVVRIKRELIKLDYPFVVRSMSIPLDSESTMSLATEQRRMA
jgi:hypothetical protein